MKHWKALVFSTLLITSSPYALAAESLNIAAVVNNQVISTFDLNERVAMAMATTGIPNTEENRSRLAPQILRQLVDERLQLEDGTRAGITIPDERIKEGISQIERQSNQPPGSLEAFLSTHGLSTTSLYAQVRAQMTWAEIVMKKIRPRIHISDQEVARYVARKSPQAAAKPVAEKRVAAPAAREVKIAVLQLPVDSPQSEPKIKKIATKLSDEIHAGVKFEAVAAQFSSSTGSTRIGEPFWVETAQLDPVIVKALTGLAKGEVSAPVRSANGYQIIKLVDFRHPTVAKPAPAKPAPEPSAEEHEPRAELAYKQILMKLKPDAEVKEAELLLKLAREVARAPGECTDTNMAGEGDLSALDFTVTLTRAQSDEMPEKLRDLLMMMKVGGVSQPVVTPEGIRLFMLCERVELPSAPTPEHGISSANETRQAIFAQKLELEAQKYMRDLRREAFVENRLQ